MAQGSGVLVIADHAAGRLAPVTLESVTAARALADATGGSVTVGVIGDDVEGPAQAAASVAGVDEVVTVSNEHLATYNGPAWTTAVAGMVEQVKPAVMLAPATTSGRDYMPRVAARLGTGHAGDAVEVALVDGQVVATRPMLESRVQSAVAFEGDGVATVTMRPGASARAAASGGSASVRSLDVSFSDDDFRAQAAPPEAPEGAGKQALASAERIVAGGRGLGEPDKFALVEQLASELNAAVAATRPLSDAGWRPHSDQIGQTGEQVSPKLYLAVGISGAVQHLVGVQNADYIVAINRDPEAPIFKIASFGIVGDLFEVVPALISELQAAKA